MNAETSPSLPAHALAVASDDAHPRCVVCAQDRAGGMNLRFVAYADGSVQADFACDGMYEGYPGLIHGGVVAAVMDGAMTHCLFARGETAVTADLHVRYRHPVCIGRPAIVKAWVTRACAPLFILSAELMQDGQVKATAAGKFMHKRASTGTGIAGSMSRTT